MRRISVFFLYFLLFSVPCYAQQARLLSIEYGKHTENQLNIAFVLSSKAKYKTFFLTGPSRFVIDFNNVSLADSFISSVAENVYVKKVRSAPRGGGDTRVVLDFKQGISLGRVAVKPALSDDKRVLLSLFIVSDVVAIEKKLEDVKKKPYIQDAPVMMAVADEHESMASEDEENDTDDGFFSDWEVSGKVSVEELGFFHNSLDAQQHNNYISGAVEPEIYREWDDGKQSFTFSPFFRYSQHDNKRTHFDIRELTWLLSEDDWELRVGSRKVFWGVAEGLHLVDIINQTDLVENTDTEDKLGQPMINLALIRDWGTLDLFILPGFRERTFAGQDGRLRSFPEVSVGHAEFEHHGFEKHMAYAVRWSHAIGDWDVGVSNFYGTSRDPVFKAKYSPSGSFSLIPYYELINQTGLDLQLTFEDWILKHEGIVRSGQGNAFYAMTTGVEYTFFDLFNSGLDLGLVGEYMYDTRGSNNTLAPFQDDFLTALRFAFNDVQSTEILAGVLFDRTNNTKFYNIEASRRIGDSFKVDVEMRFYSGAPPSDASYVVREDDHIRIEVGYYF